ncbi:SdrD B-like domain-containing protein [Allokutzneria oryzae]|uniref:SdrD B-like domain-containing protein n=1 Tax=Allokutzneria oryzae TaxID=1378989 RepID=A0ABV6A3X7_9PSEU
MRSTTRSVAAAALALCSTIALTLPASASAEASATGLVWADTDFDGVQDEGEAGVGDITIAAYRADNTEAGSAVTDKSGRYSLPLTGGPYKLRPKSLPFANTVTRPDVGDDARDSDFDWNGWETASFSCAPGCPTADLGLVPRKQDIAIAVAPNDKMTSRNNSFPVDVTVSNVGTVPNGADWIDVGIQPGLDITSASGDGWACKIDKDAAWPNLFCRSEAGNDPGTSRPPIRVWVNPTVERGDLNMDFGVAGFRRSESVFTNNVATLRVRVS